MPYKNIEERKKYHREYMGGYNKTHPLTPEQKKRKNEYMQGWNRRNKGRVKVLSHKSYLKNKEKRYISMKKYREDNKELCKITHHKYYLSRKDYFKNKSNEYYANNRESIRTYKRAYSYTIKSRYPSYRYGAKKRNLSFLLARDKFDEIMLSNCHYCNVPRAFGVDRKNSDKGYEDDNVVPCCKICNFMKRDIQYNDFILQVKKIYENTLSYESNR